MQLLTNTLCPAGCPHYPRCIQQSATADTISDAQPYLWCHTQLIVESMVPDLLHVIPVSHDTVLNGVTQRQDTTLGLRLVTHVVVLQQLQTMPYQLQDITIRQTAGLYCSAAGCN
jgi:hypothetical protein